MTGTEIKKRFSTIYCVGYCNMQFLLRYQKKIGSNSGTYGWNYDIYAVNDVAICTGYRGMPGERINYQLTRKYEEKARKICEDWTLSREDHENEINKLLNEFLEEVRK